MSVILMVGILLIGAASGFADDVERIAKAKSEGQVVFYTTMGIDTVRPVTIAFRKKISVPQSRGFAGALRKTLQSRDGFPYRSARHLALLHIVNESGGWKKQDLAVEYDFYVDPEEAHKLLKSGKVQFIGGNHITPYIKRATGDDWIYVGQSANYIGQAIVVKKESKIRRLEDLRARRWLPREPAAPTHGSMPG